jgi:hypothetical protein
VTATGDGSASAQGIPPFHVHPGHVFEGFELVERSDAPPMLVVRCGCGAVLDSAEARLQRCPACDASDSSRGRCAGTGRVIDPAALEWTAHGDAAAN